MMKNLTKPLMNVRSTGHDYKYSVFYVLKLYFASNITLRSFWASNILFVIGRLVVDWCNWLMVS